MFYEHKKHKTLFMSTKSYAQDVAYEHKMLFMSVGAQNDAHRCCLWAQMSTNDAHRCCLWGHKMSTRWTQDVIYEHKILFISTKNIKNNFFFLSCFLLAQNVTQVNKMFFMSIKSIKNTKSTNKWLSFF